MRNVSNKTCRGNQTTHFVFSICFFETLLVYEMWKNIVERARPQMKIWCMRNACWITKATNTLSEYLILNAFPLQQWLREHTSILRLYILQYIACLVAPDGGPIALKHLRFSDIFITLFKSNSIVYIC